MSEPYVVGGRTFRVGERCLILSFSFGWLSGVLTRVGAGFIGVDAVATGVNGAFRYLMSVEPGRILLLSDNFAPGA